MPSYTVSELNILKSAIATGTKSVQYADKMVNYRTLDEMLEIKRLMEIELGIGEGAPTNKGRRRYGTFSKGTC